MNNKTEITIPIKAWIEKTEGVFVGKIDDDNYPQLSGCIVQADSEEDVIKQLSILVKVMLRFYEKSMRKGWKRSIFRGNKSNNQLWFTIIGIGMVFYWRSKEFSKKFPQLKPKYRFHIGRLWFSFKNEWKNIKK